MYSAVIRCSASFVVEVSLADTGRRCRKRQVRQTAIRDVGSATALYVAGWRTSYDRWRRGIGKCERLHTNIGQSAGVCSRPGSFHYPQIGTVGRCRAGDYILIGDGRRSTVVGSRCRAVLGRRNARILWRVRWYRLGIKTGRPFDWGRVGWARDGRWCGVGEGKGLHAIIELAATVGDGPRPGHHPQVGAVGRCRAGDHILVTDRHRSTAAGPGNTAVIDRIDTRILRCVWSNRLGVETGWPFDRGWTGRAVDDHRRCRCIDCQCLRTGLCGIVVGNGIGPSHDLTSADIIRRIVGI